MKLFFLSGKKGGGVWQIIIFIGIIFWYNYTFAPFATKIQRKIRLVIFFFFPSNKVDFLHTSNEWVSNIQWLLFNYLSFIDIELDKHWNRYLIILCVCLYLCHYGNNIILNRLTIKTCKKNYCLLLKANFMAIFQTWRRVFKEFVILSL